MGKARHGRGCRSGGGSRSGGVGSEKQGGGQKVGVKAVRGGILWEREKGSAGENREIGKHFATLYVFEIAKDQRHRNH